MNSIQANQALSVLGSSAGAAAIAKLVTDQLSDWVAVPGSLPDPKPSQTAVGFAQGVSLRPGKSNGRSKSRRPRGQDVNKDDLSVKPLPPSIPSNVPSNISNRLAWDVLHIRQTRDLQVGISEQNFQFALSAHPQAASWIALYDQWCIPMFSVKFMSVVANGSNVSNPEVHTALDWDGVANLGSITKIDQYDNAHTSVLGPGRSHVRSVKPAITVANNGGNSIVRQWCDCAQSGTVWSGIRSIINSNAILAGGIVQEFTVWYCFRNRI